MTESLIIRRPGLVEYQLAYEAMTVFTGQREENSHDEIWLLQHNPVFTLGMAGRMEHVHQLGNVPLVRTDRGGQVTYHGPGQLIVYLMLDLKRRKQGIKDYVSTLEQAVINYLEQKEILAERIKGAPGVYVKGKKIAALGIRVRRSCAYHGLALNIDMDVQPFSNINPCGYENLEIAQLVDYKPKTKIAEVEDEFLQQLLDTLGLQKKLVKTKFTLDDLLADNAAA